MLIHRSSLRVLGAADDGAAGTRAPAAAGAVNGTLLVIRSGFPCSMCFPCGVPGLFQMVCQLFFSVLAPLSNDAHLLKSSDFRDGKGDWDDGLVARRRGRRGPDPDWCFRS